MRNFAILFKSIVCLLLLADNGYAASGLGYGSKSYSPTAASRASSPSVARSLHSSYSSRATSPVRASQSAPTTTALAAPSRTPSPAPQPYDLELAYMQRLAAYASAYDNPADNLMDVPMSLDARQMRNSYIASLAPTTSATANAYPRQESGSPEPAAMLAAQRSARRPSVASSTPASPYATAPAARPAAQLTPSERIAEIDAELSKLRVEALALDDRYLPTIGAIFTKENTRDDFWQHAKGMLVINDRKDTLLTERRNLERLQMQQRLQRLYRQ